jgi:hypothetical protein
MKRVIGLLILVGCTIVSANAQLEKIPDLKPGNSPEEKKRVSRDLINVRDSLNMFLAAVTNRIEKDRADPVIRKRLSITIDELRINKEAIDKIIEEVALTRDDAWGLEIQDKASRVAKDVRRNSKKIRDDVKDLILINS